jgi:hypothetical protein
MESECKMQRRKPLGEKFFGKLRGTLPCPAKKKFQLFLNSHHPKVRQIPKSPKTAEVTVLGFL